MKHKDATDYTGIEYKIQEFLSNEDISWFPFNGEDDEKDEVQDIVKKLSSYIDEKAEKTESLLEKGISTFRDVVKQI